MAPKQPAKPVFTTCTPFTATTWPQLAQTDQDTILDLVCKQVTCLSFALPGARQAPLTRARTRSLLAPIGDHRRAHVSPSRRGKKRKRAAKTDDPAPPAPPPPSPPPPPAIAHHILVGLNAVTRHLERRAAQDAPPATAAAGAGAITTATTSSTTNHDLAPALILLTHPKPSLSPAHAHIPTLLHLSTLGAHAPNPPTRLVALATTADARLASKLAIPRVGALAILDGAPGAGPLLAWVRERVGLTQCAWVDEALSAEWRGVRVEAKTKTAPVVEAAAAGGGATKNK